MKKFKITKGNRVYIVDAKSHIDAISKVKSVKTGEVRDSISQWNPGMSEIGLFQISYKRNGVYQSILVRANSEEQAKQKLLNNLNGVDIIGVNSHPSPHFHEPILDSSIKDINQVLLSNLEQVAQKGDAWRNKWKKLLDMTDKCNSYQWKELRNNDPKKYELIIRNKEYAEKEAEALNREWDRAIDALSRDRSFGRPGDYRMDLHSYKSRNDNYPMGNSQRYDEILYGYEQAEKSAREKKGLDSSIKDDGYYYLLRDAIDLLTKPGAARGWSQPYLEEVQEYMVQKGINPTNVNQWKKKYESLTKDSSIKDEWSGIRSNGVIFNYSNGKYTITHKNGKVETFPGNKFNTVEELFKYIDNIKDSAIKDMPLMFKSNVNMQSLKSNIDNVKNKPNETYINSLNANIQGIIADIEEIKGYEKEGKFNESPALKFSCKNLTAQYYKLLNDPKLQGTLHKLDVPTYKNVLYAEHQAQMLSQVTLKDSAIKDSYGWSYIMAPMKTPGDKDLNLLSKLMSTYYDYIYQDVYDIRKAFAKTTDRRVAINMVKDTPKYQYFIKMLDMVDKDWNAVIRKYPKLKKFNINTTGAERLLYGYYPTTKDFVDEITPVIKKEW